MPSGSRADDTGGTMVGLRLLVGKTADLLDCDVCVLALRLAEGMPLPLPVGEWSIVASEGVDPAAAAVLAERLGSVAGAASAPLGDVDDGGGEGGFEALGLSVAEATASVSHAVVPVRGARGGRGFVFGGDRRRDSVSPGDRRLLETLGAAAEAALDAASVAAGYVEAREKEISALHEIMKEISALGSLDRVLELICRKSAELLGVEISYVALADRAQRELRMRMTHGISPYWRDRMAMEFGVGVGGTVAQQRRPLIIEDYADFEHPTRQDIRDMVNSEGVKAIVAVPMLVADKVTGVLYAADRRPAQFTERDARLLQGMADQAAIAIANSQLYEQERREVEVHDRLSAIVLRDGDYAAIAEALYGLVGNPTALYDNHGNLLACHPPDLEGGCPAELTAVREPTILPASPEEGLEAPLAIAPVWSGEELLGHVQVLQRTRSLDVYDLRVVERASVIVALRMMRMRVEAEVEQRLRGDILDDLLAEDTETVQSAVRRSQHLGQDLSRPHSVFLAELGETSAPLSSDRAPRGANGGQARQHLFLQVRRALAGAQLEALTNLKGERVVALIPRPLDQDEAADFERRLERALRARLQTHLPGIAVRAGLGAAAARPEDLRRSYDEALACLRATRERVPGLSFLTHDELGVLGILYDPGDPGRLSRFVHMRLGGLVDYDAAHRSDLVHTLGVYLDSACNKIETSRTLNIHLSTLKYRLERVGTILDLDLTDPDVRFEAHLATRALAAERRLTRSGD